MSGKRPLDLDRDSDETREKAASCAGTKPDVSAGSDTRPDESMTDEHVDSDPQNTVAEAEASEEGDVEAALRQAKMEAKENYDRFLRAAAELDNFRKRTAKVRTEAREDILRDVLTKIAPVLDNLNRALTQDSSDATALRQGVGLIRTQLLDVLAGYGLKPMEAVGQPFDPNLHEAMMELESSDYPPATVMEEMEKGYMLNDKVVKPARVIVSKSGQ